MPDAIGCSLDQLGFVLPYLGSASPAVINCGYFKLKRDSIRLRKKIQRPLTENFKMLNLKKRVSTGREREREREDVLNFNLKEIVFIKKG